MVGRIKNRKTEIDGWLVGWIYKLYEKNDGWMGIFKKQMDVIHIHNYLLYITYPFIIHT